MQQKKNRKRLAITVALVACLAAVAGLGTLAWLTAQDDVSNVFTIGNFPGPGNKPGTDNPDDPNDDADKEESAEENLGGYLFETAWDKNNNKLVADVPVAKNPNVGIGAKGDDAYVFLYVQNNTLQSGKDVAQNAPYFEIEKQWKPVEPYADKSSAWNEDKTGYVDSKYVGGLFMYAWDDAKNTATADPAILVSSEEEDKDTYTGELFENVTMPLHADFKDYVNSPQINVYAFIYGADSTADSGDDGSADAAKTAAIEWMGKIERGEIKPSPVA